MAECAMLEKCIFFNDKMAGMPVTAGMMKKQYCLKDFENCARYKVNTALGKEKVPADLYPNNIEQAQDIFMNG